MPDFAACNNDDCLRRHECCRWLMDVGGYPAKVQQMQSFLVVFGDGSDCQEFWPLESGAPFRLRIPKE